MTKGSLIFVFILLMVCSCSSTRVISNQPRLEYSYNKLKLLEVDEMDHIIQERIFKFNKTQNPDFLQEALTICLSRPNSDNLTERLMQSIRNSVETNTQWERVIETLTEKSISALKNESTAAIDQVTYSFVLQNMLAEFKSDFYKQDISLEFEHKIITQIAGANIKVTDEAKDEASLNLVGRPVSASIIAASILEEIAKIPSRKK